MLRKLRIYLDTSVINFLFAEDAPEERDITREFLDERLVRHDVYISDTVLVEIANTRDPAKRGLLQEAVSHYALRSVDPHPDDQGRIMALATEYIKRRVVPASQWEDALHVAMATVLGFDILLSWNFRHMANVERQKKINRVNHDCGYEKQLLLVTPMEVLNEGENE